MDLEAQGPGAQEAEPMERPGIQLFPLDTEELGLRLRPGACACVPMRCVCVCVRAHEVCARALRCMCVCAHVICVRMCVWCVLFVVLRVLCVMCVVCVCVVLHQSHPILRDQGGYTSSRDPTLPSPRIPQTLGLAGCGGAFLSFPLLGSATGPQETSTPTSLEPVPLLRGGPRLGASGVRKDGLSPVHLPRG